MEKWRDELYHHGVMGMHWGIRRYQPYSLIPRGSGKRGKETGLAASRKSRKKDKDSGSANSRSSMRALKRSNRQNIKAIKKQNKAELKKAAAADLKEAKKEAVQNYKAEKKSIRRSITNESVQKKAMDRVQKDINKGTSRDEKFKNSSKYASEKERVLKSGSAKDILKFQGDLTNAELKAAKDRLNLERDIKDIAAKDKAASKGKVDKVFNTIDTVRGYTETSINAYNTFAKVANSLGGLDLKYIEKDGSGLSKAMKAMKAENEELKIKVNNANMKQKLHDYENPAPKDSRETQQMGVDSKRMETEMGYEATKNKYDEWKKSKSSQDDDIPRYEGEVVYTPKYDNMQYDYATTTALTPYDKRKAKHSAIPMESWRKELYTNELYHHGVMGMHWGVRRYQPYSVKPRGSGKSGKEVGEAKRYTRYREKEAKATNKKYESKIKDYQKQIDRAGKWKSKAAAKGRTEDAKVINEYQKKLKGDIKQFKKDLDAELKIVSKLTPEQIKKEKREVAKSRVKTALIAAGTTAATGGRATLISYQKKGGIKTDMRFNPDAYVTRKEAKTKALTEKRDQTFDKWLKSLEEQPKAEKELTKIVNSETKKYIKANPAPKGFSKSSWEESSWEMINDKITADKSYKDLVDKAYGTESDKYWDKYQKLDKKVNKR